MTRLTVVRAGPLASVQDEGRVGHLGDGISASGPMDTGAFSRAGARLSQAGRGGIEFSQSFTFAVHGAVQAAFDGGDFRVRHNRDPVAWPATLALEPDDRVEITPGQWGNFGYVRFDRELAVPPLLGSQATNVTVGLGGWKGRALRDGDSVAFGSPGQSIVRDAVASSEGPLRIIWGLHADLFDPAVRSRFVEIAFTVSRGHDRMGVRLSEGSGLFSQVRRLSLVSDPIVCGDIQILGDGTPVVLMRDHQPTGGYPRIATIVSADIDRFAQMRPGDVVRFRSVSLGNLR